MKQLKLPTVYFVDSENVNDVWIRLVTEMDAQDEILVFYTEKSPHMSYEKVIELTRLADRPIRWIKCVEGNNALDFQLVTELGARVATQKGHAFVIVSNDNGFDAVVKYWSQRDISIRRMKSTECKQLCRKPAHTGNEQEPPQEEALEICPEDPSVTGFAYLADIEELGKSVPLSKLTLFHDAFVCMYDQDIGDAIYYYMKDHKEELAYLDQRLLPKRKARLKNYFSMAFVRAGADLSDLDDMMDIYHHTDEPKKNLQKLNVEAVKKFGQEKGSSYYKILKKHVKVMSKLQDIK